MPRKQHEFKLAIWDQAADSLSKLPQKPKSEIGISAKNGLKRIKSSIKKAEEFGYSHHEIVEKLVSVGIKISLSTFKSYIEPKKKMKSKKQTQHHKQNLSNSGLKKQNKSPENKPKTSKDFDNDDKV